MAWLGLTTLFVLAELLVPGYLVLRSLRFSRSWSLCWASSVSCGAIALWCQALALVGVFASPWTVLLPIVVLGVLARIVIGPRLAEPGLPQIRLRVVILYAAVGVVVGYLLFVRRLPAGDYVYPQYDVMQHLNLTTAFSQSGHMSSLGTSPYLTAADMAIDPTPNHVFYPAAYHSFCALATQALGVRAPVALNAATFAFSFLVYPLAMLSFLAMTFRGLDKAQAMGSLAVCSLVSFPWVVIIWGPIYPNLAGMALLPCASSILMGLTRADCGDGRMRVRLVALLALSATALALMHPNTIFAAIVTLLPYCLWRLWDLPWARERKAMWRLMAPLSFLLLVIGFWTLCLRLPLFSEMLQENWPSFVVPRQELMNILGLAFTFGMLPSTFSYQLLLAVMVLVGFACALHDRERRWLCATYVIWCCMCFVGATSDGELKTVLTGFWYTDPVRVAACAAMAAVPLATLGIRWTHELALVLVRRYNRWRGHQTHPTKATCLLSVLFLALVFMPGFDLPWSDAPRDRMVDYASDTGSILKRSLTIPNVHTAFGDWRLATDELFDLAPPLFKNEQAFADRARKITGDSLVINDPMDGSFLAYPVCGVRCYYRSFVGVGDTNETEASKLVRLHLSEAAARPDVRAAIRELDAQYVLKLDLAYADVSFVNLREDLNFVDFAGIESVSDDTPGFERVLVAGKLRLYRIALD